MRAAAVSDWTTTSKMSDRRCERGMCQVNWPSRRFQNIAVILMSALWYVHATAHGRLPPTDNFAQHADIIATAP